MLQRHFARELAKLRRVGSERIRDVTGLLARANGAERHELRLTLQDLIQQAKILELSATVLSRAQEIERRFDLQLGDTIVCATIL
jgi:predicted nucleic acid-binding protein